MSKYYCLIAGLPNLAPDDSKMVYSVAEFKEELSGILSRSDKKLLDWFFLKYDNRNLLAFLQNPEAELDRRGVFAPEQLTEWYRAWMQEGILPKQANIPIFYRQFLSEFMEAQTADKPEAVSVSWDDCLAALYYAQAMRCGNRFVADWFELNLNINNVLTAITCRKHGLDKTAYIVGDNEVARAILSSNARDFGVADLVEYLPELLRIAEEPDLLMRERRMDLLKWNWLEENTFFKTFDVESVFAYLLKLEMIERWVKLDKEQGEQTFRRLVGAMKQGSLHALEEFKKNNN